MPDSSDEFQPIDTHAKVLYEHHMLRVKGRSRVEGYWTNNGFEVNGKLMDPQPDEWQPLWMGEGYDPDPINIKKHDPGYKFVIPVDRQRRPQG